MLWLEAIVVVVAPLSILQSLQLMEKCSTSAQCSQQNVCMVWMSYITSWVSQFEISSSGLARALFRVVISIFTTVVINWKLGYSGIQLYLQKYSLKCQQEMLDIH